MIIVLKEQMEKLDCSTIHNGNIIDNIPYYEYETNHVSR